MTALPQASSPCRPHPCSVEHAAVVWSYRERRDLWERQAEATTLGYADELEHYRESHPAPLFRDHLIEWAREHREH
jgi:hypothetical protein